ncbi:unnamed protein product [Tenebrio molitor]|nr:unnamed protein product [Tenebrio molitor]
MDFFAIIPVFFILISKVILFISVVFQIILLTLKRMTLLIYIPRKLI